jgi:hypothetical protein
VPFLSHLVPSPSTSRTYRTHRISVEASRPGFLPFPVMDWHTLLPEDAASDDDHAMDLTWRRRPRPQVVPSCSSSDHVGNKPSRSIPSTAGLGL